MGYAKDYPPQGCALGIMCVLEAYIVYIACSPKTVLKPRLPRSPYQRTDERRRHAFSYKTTASALAAQSRFGGPATRPQMRFNPLPNVVQMVRLNRMRFPGHGLPTKSVSGTVPDNYLEAGLPTELDAN
jgi:hypothetical protein